MSSTLQKRPSHLEIPGQNTRPRPMQMPSQRLPPTALFHGPFSQEGSQNSPLPQDRANSTEHEPHQRLPRASAPTASFSGPRPSLIGGSRLQSVGTRDEEFRADALWTEMQKTLADVELSAMNSSHVFSSTHAMALEDLRTSQLGLAQAWAKSEADEMGDEEFGGDDAEANIGILKAGMYQGNSGGPGKNKSRAGSASSASGRDLEEETERDIRIARKRREANDRYFQQVNKGVLDVVSKLDEVAAAMRRVEKESREIWNDSSGSEELGEVTETERSAIATDTDATGMTDSPVEVRR